MTAFDHIAADTAFITLVLLIIYLRKHRHQEEGVYSATAAWLRGFIYFGFCIIVSWHSGALEATLTSICVTQEQLSDPVWWLATAGVYLFIYFAYWRFWSSHTIRFDREIEFFPQLVFGLFWGLTSGLLFLSFWYYAAAISDDLPTWGIWLIAYTAISVWQMIVMDMYWDIYVSPEHDSPYSIKLKVPRTHIPNMTLCLTYFAFYDNHWIFISLQTLALLAAVFGMRMPSPWSAKATIPAKAQPGLFGFPRCAGYQSNDPDNDPYLKAANLPR